MNIRKNKKKSLLFLTVTGIFLSSLFPGVAFAGEHGSIDLTQNIAGYLSIAVFCLAYILVMTEEITHLRKSKPVILAAGLIWAMIGFVYTSRGMSKIAEDAVRGNILEYAELFFFLLVAMTYINSMEERGVFSALRSWLVRKGFSFRQIFWLTGVLSFFISPVADNLTTALLMGAVIMAVGVQNPRFVAIASINVVVAANAGGAFSPFGDITTLMVWQKGMVDFWQFFRLFVPSAVNFIVPAVLMSFAIPNVFPEPSTEVVKMKYGAKPIILLFFLTIATAVGFHSFLGLPPVLGMMTGLSYLQFLGYFLRTYKKKHVSSKPNSTIGDVVAFDVFRKVARVEWDTLLFFFGVVLSVGGLGFLGYLSLTSELLYTQLGPTNANVIIGVLSAVVDNIPVMYAVLTMQPDMSLGQWLLVTMTAGVGGSLLSIGSAAGVALMGQTKGIYTFFGHLKWMPAIALGYAASIMTHMWVNAATF
ncbi:MAG TPA: sodium:proton antiporter [Rhodospirillales bacterium]|nr:sodium:proton antiporter [Rhodospirillales bacterium]